MTGLDVGAVLNARYSEARRLLADAQDRERHLNALRRDAGVAEEAGRAWAAADMARWEWKKQLGVLHGLEAVADDLGVELADDRRPLLRQMGIT